MKLAKTARELWNETEKIEKSLKDKPVQKAKDIRLWKSAKDLWADSKKIEKKDKGK